MKKIIWLIVLIIIIVGGYFLIKDNPASAPVDQATTTAATSSDQTGVPQDDTMTVLGKSAEGNDITAYHYGAGDKDVLFVGGIHGGYEWNTSLVAYELMDYLEANPTKIPAGVRVSVIPVMNPDGLEKVVGTTDRFTAADVATSQEVVVSGRFNANNVDLNRNFDCDWQASGVWQNRAVSGGTAAFSEPESKAIQSYINANEPDAVVVWYSAAGGVFASNCHNDVLPATLALTNAYADASGYPAYETFDFYEITGDMVNWLAKEEIPAISVLLTDHTNIEWDKNLKGIEAVLAYIAG